MNNITIFLNIFSLKILILVSKLLIINTINFFKSWKK